MKSLNDVKVFLNNIPNINKGGCGIALFSLYKWLEKNNKLSKFKFIYMHRSKSEEYENNRKFLNNENIKPCAPCHCFLKIGNRYIDSRDDWDEEELKKWGSYELKTDDINFLIKSIKNKSSWNCRFDRDNIFKIEKGLNISLNEIGGKRRV